MIQPVLHIQKPIRQQQSLVVISGRNQF